MYKIKNIIKHKAICEAWENMRSCDYVEIIYSAKL